MSSTTAPAAKGAAKHGGSSFSDKQIAQTVKDGAGVEFVLDGETHTGWVFGSDNFHWGVVSAAGTIRLVHKSLPCLTVLDWLLLKDQSEGIRAVVEPVVAPFRAYVMKHHFSQNHPS